MPVVASSTSPRVQGIESPSGSAGRITVGGSASAPLARDPKDERELIANSENGI